MTNEIKHKLKFLFTNAVTLTPWTRSITDRYWFFGVMILMFGLLLMFSD